MSDDLITWLRAQLDDDEIDARAAGREARHGGILMLVDRTLAEVDAKRRILDEILKYEAVIDGEWGDGHTAEQIAAGLCPETDPDEIPAIRLLALPYADRDGYRPEWAPDA